MNKQDKEVFLKKNITMYAKKIRDVQSEQIDPYIELIETELRQLYPELIDKEDGVENWACDIVNASSNSEVIGTLDRIEQILEEELRALKLLLFTDKRGSTRLPSIETYWSPSTGFYSIDYSFYATDING